MTFAATMRVMIELGLNDQQKLMLLDAIEADAGPSRTAGAERQRRYRQKQKANESDVTSDVTSNATKGVTSPPYEEDTSTPRNKPSPSGDGQKPVDQVVLAWNAMAKRTGLKPILKLNADRRTRLNARLREHGLANVLAAVAKVEASDFLRGKAGDWKGASFDFFISESKMLRILEGAYDNEGAVNGTAKPLTAEQCDRNAAALERRQEPEKAEYWRKEAERLRATVPSGQAIGASVLERMKHVAMEAHT